jgi:hypothetical protein
VKRFLLTPVLAACLWAQQAPAQLEFDIHPVTGRASDRLLETQRRLRVAQQSSWRVVKAPEERAALDATLETYGVHFQPEIDSDPKIATLTYKGDDILVARWTATRGSTAFSELIVRDTPYDTSLTRSDVWAAMTPPQTIAP